MSRQLKVTLLVFVTLVPLFFSLQCHAKPPKPGPNFVWVEAHTTPEGHVIPGHWNYVGPQKKGQVWVPAHYAPDGDWVPGHWKDLEARPRPKAVWVPGHHGPRGRWIPGHWR